MSRRAGYIGFSRTPVSGVNGAASGVWKLDDVQEWARTSSWPASPSGISTPANLRMSNCYDGTATITWNSVAGANSYRLEWSDAQNGTYSLAYSGASTSFEEVLGQFPGGSRWFRVRAESVSSGNSEWSTPITASCPYW